jgi:hypothetical protein
MKAEVQRTCPSCGNEFSGEMEFCPVCMLRKGLAGGVASGDSSFEEAAKPTPDQPPKRFENYELVTGEGGKPVELGRGAMGVTYKAFDVDLQCPVTLKVISERYLGDESARVRFLREARAAAKVRHLNVASVFHLGRTGQNYFYAMEFVGGETLEHLIKRSGQVKVEKALLSYNVSKATELSNPMDLNSAPTGNTCFVLTEIYESKAGVLDHFEQTAGWGDFPGMLKWMEECKVTFVSAASIINSLW